MNQSLPVPPVSMSRLRRVAVAAACAVLFAACLVAYTWHNTFPTSYHPDEQLKGLAIVEGQFKFTQPLLLTSTTGLVAWITGHRHTIQEAVVTGRRTSAAFAAVAVILLALAAGWQHGVLAGIVVGIGVGSSHRLMVWAHYMKEDTALAMGLAAFLLAAHVYWQRPSTRTMAAMGAACGLAVAAKYVGALTIPLAWLLVGSKAGPDTRPGIKPFVWGCLIVMAVTHLPALLHPGRFWSDLAYEIGHPLVGHRGVRRPILWASPYWGMYLREIPWPVWLAGLGSATVGLVTWRRQTAPQRLALAIPLVYWGLLLFSALSEPRHLLPVVVFTYYFAGVGIAWVATRLPAPAMTRSGVAALAAIGLIALSAREAIPAYREFHHDTRETMRLWIAQNLARTDAIAAELYAALPSDESIKLAAFSPADRLPQRLETARFLPDLGSLEELRARGFTHVVVAEPTYGRYFDPDSRPTQKHSAEFASRRDWYDRLFTEGELVQEFSPPTPTRSQSSPTVRLYHLR